MYNPAFFTRFPQRSWLIPKNQDRNYIAACFHLLVIALTCTSIAQLSWFRVYGGECASQLKLYQFFSFKGYFDTSFNTKHLELSGEDVISTPVTVSYYSSNGILACVTPKIANLMRILILLCFMVLIFSIAGFFLDVTGPTNRALRGVRRNSICSTFAVLWIVAIIGVCYYVTTLLGFEAIPTHKSIVVSYDYGCYTITVAGAIAVIGTASNLLQVYSPSNEDIQRRQLVDDWEDLETFSVDPQLEDPFISIIQPPPPYTP